MADSGGGKLEDVLSADASLYFDSEVGDGGEVVSQSPLLCLVEDELARVDQSVDTVSATVTACHDTAISELGYLLR